MDFSRGHRVKDRSRIKQWQNGGIRVNTDAVLVIRLPDSRILRVISRSILLAMIILALPSIGNLLNGLDSSVDHRMAGYNVVDVEFLDSILQDLANEGLIKKGDKGLIVSTGTEIYNLQFLNTKGIDLVKQPALDQESAFSSGTFDYVFAFGVEDVKSVDYMVKVGGVVVTLMSSDLLQNQVNYRLMYVRQYNSIIVVMKKISLANELVDSLPRRLLLQMEMKNKKVALNGLEDALLEPPRKALVKSRKYSKNFHYLPDLLGDSLEDYTRRIFVHAGPREERKAVSVWFNKNYPTRNKEFEHYNIDTSPEGRSKSGELSFAVSNWLTKHVQEDEFVVMKAEANDVEAMVKQGIIGLVDELFLECNNQWQNGGRQKSNRAYWECLALYGKLRDEGVAVHQWWG